MHGLSNGTSHAGAMAKLDVSVQALHLVHRPLCWARLSKAPAGMPRESHSKSVTEAVNALGNVEAQNLAQAQRAIKTAVLPAVNLQVSHTATHVIVCSVDSVFAQHDAAPKHSCMHCTSCAL